MELADRILRFGTKGVVHRHNRPLLRTGVKNQPFGDGDAEMFFQTKRLGAELDAIIAPLRLPARFVFHRPGLGDAPAGFAHLHDIGLAVEAEFVGPDREGAQKFPPGPVFEARQIGMFVVQVAAQGVFVGGPQTVENLESSTPFAIEEIINERERERVHPAYFRVARSGLLCQLKAVKITLTKPIEDFIKQQLAKGYSDPGEVARQALLRWMEDEAGEEQLPRLHEKIAEARQGPFRPFDPQRYDALVDSSHEAAR